MFNSTSCVDDSKVNGRKGAVPIIPPRKKNMDRRVLLIVLLILLLVLYTYIYIYMSDLNEVTDKMIENQ